MQLLTEARQKLQSCARAAQSPLLELEQKGRQIELELKAMSGQAGPRLALVRRRCQAFRTSLDAQAVRTRAAGSRPSD